MAGAAVVGAAVVGAAVVGAAVVGAAVVGDMVVVAAREDAVAVGGGAVEPMALVVSVGSAGGEGWVARAAALVGDEEPDSIVPVYRTTAPEEAVEFDVGPSRSSEEPRVGMRETASTNTAALPKAGLHMTASFPPRLGFGSSVLW